MGTMMIFSSYNLWGLLWFRNCLSSHVPLCGTDLKLMLSGQYFLPDRFDAVVGCSVVSPLIRYTINVTSAS